MQLQFKYLGCRQHSYFAIFILTDSESHTLVEGTFISPTNLVPNPIIEGGVVVEETSM